MGQEARLLLSLPLPLLVLGPIRPRSGLHRVPPGTGVSGRGGRVGLPTSRPFARLTWRESRWPGPRKPAPNFPGRCTHFDLDPKNPLFSPIVLSHQGLGIFRVGLPFILNLEFVSVLGFRLQLYLVCLCEFYTSSSLLSFLHTGGTSLPFLKRLCKLVGLWKVLLYEILS